MLRHATRRFLPVFAEASAVPSVSSMPVLASLPRPALTRRNFSATLRRMQDEKSEEKPAEEKKDDGANGNAVEEELRKTVAAREKRIAELQVLRRSLGSLLSRLEAHYIAGFDSRTTTCGLWQIPRT